MAVNLPFIIDITNSSKQGLQSSFLTKAPASVPLLIRNDQESLSIRFVQPSATQSRPWDDVNYSSATIYAAIGTADQQATGGSFTVQFGPTTTGNTTISSTSVTITGSTSGIVNGMKCAGAGIVTGTTITISGSTVTLSQAATASGTGVALYFYNETAQLACNATAATVSTAVNALASVTAQGGVSVTSTETGTYLFTATNTGTFSGVFSGSATGLTPTCGVGWQRLVTGASGISEQQLLEYFAQPYALNSTWSPFPTASANVSTLTSGTSVLVTAALTSGNNQVTVTSATGLAVGQSVFGTGITVGTYVQAISGTTITLNQNATVTNATAILQFATSSVWSMSITPGAYDGTISITTGLVTTPAISIPTSGLTPALIQTALNSSGANYSVTGNQGGPFTISDPTGNSTTPTVNVSNMIVPIGLTGIIGLNTIAILEQFVNAGTSTISATLEIQVLPSSGQQTVLQVPVTINKNVIQSGVIVPTPIIGYLTSAQAAATYDQKNYSAANLGSGISSYVVTGQGWPSTPASIQAWINYNGTTGTSPQMMVATVDTSTQTANGFTCYFAPTLDAYNVLCWKAYL
jgi:hypothetical protein